MNKEPSAEEKLDGEAVEGERRHKFPIFNSIFYFGEERFTSPSDDGRRARKETGGKAAIINEEKRNDVIEKWTVIINM